MLCTSVRQARAERCTFIKWSALWQLVCFFLLCNYVQPVNCLP
jgi:hypothetical protein